MTDRKSRYLICRKLKSRTSAQVNEALIEALRDKPLESITPDRGKELARHAWSRVLFSAAAPVVGEGETNENTNGLLREYYPKGSDFGKVTQEELKEVVEDLNSRPRKKLGYRTPAEVWL